MPEDDPADLSSMRGFIDDDVESVRRHIVSDLRKELEVGLVAFVEVYAFGRIEGLWD